MGSPEAYNLYTGEIVRFMQRKFSTAVFPMGQVKPVVIHNDLFKTLFKKL